MKPLKTSKWLIFSLLLTMIAALWPIGASAAVAGVSAAANEADYIEVEAAQSVSGITDYVALFTPEYATQITVGTTSVGVVVDAANHVTRVVNPSVNGGVPVWTGPTDLLIPQGGYVLVANDDSWANKTYKQYLAKNFKVGDAIKLRKNGEVVPVTALMMGQGLKAQLKLTNDDWSTVTVPKLTISGKLENVEPGIPYSIQVNQTNVTLRADQRSKPLIVAKRQM